MATASAVTTALGLPAGRRIVVVSESAEGSMTYRTCPQRFNDAPRERLRLGHERAQAAGPRLGELDRPADTPGHRAGRVRRSTRRGPADPRPRQGLRRTVVGDGQAAP